MSAYKFLNTVLCLDGIGIRSIFRIPERIVRLPAHCLESHIPFGKGSKYNLGLIIFYGPRD